MFQFLRHALIVLLCAACLFSGRNARTQVVLKPNGRNAVPLRTKAIQANIAIEGQYAVNKLALTFQNETSEQIEADFIYTLPANTLVTAFAYWYGQEKVVARIVEKQEAAAIYRHITTHMRDPALVEMVGKNSFRARIFPVLPNSDLKVEMTLVQTLPSDAQGASYTFPLQMPRGSSLDSVDVRIHVKASWDVTRVTNANGLPVQHTEGGVDIRLRGTNYRPQKDLQIRLRRSPMPLHAVLYAAPSTRGRDGFFVLALTPNRFIANPKVRIQGVTTYQVVPDGAATIKANHAYTVVGRYKGSGEARVFLTGTSPNVYYSMSQQDQGHQSGGSWRYKDWVAEGPVTLTQPLLFPTRNVPNNLASKLWAAAYMSTLSADKNRRATVIALSKRYGMPSRFTSWLAVPQLEMQRYEKEMLEAKREPVTRRLAEEVLNNRPNSPTARKLREQLRQLCRKAGQDANTALDNYFEYRYNHVGETLSDLYIHHAESTMEARKLRMELDRIAQYKNHQGEYTNFVAFWVVNQKLQAMGQELASQRNDTSQAAQTLAEMERLAHLTGLRAQDYVNQGLQARHGDPLLSIEAPPDAQQIIAIMPGGEIKRLAYSAASHHWEARFDIPTYAAEGAYSIKIVIVLSDGTRKMQVFHYHVDVTPPTGSGHALTVTSAHPALRLELEASPDTARVKALLPWGEEISLQPGSRPHTFFALIPLPSNLSSQKQSGQQLSAPKGAVTYILTDKAHNRTVITVDMEK